MTRPALRLGHLALFAALLTVACLSPAGACKTVSTSCRYTNGSGWVSSVNNVKTPSQCCSACQGYSQCRKWSLETSVVRSGRSSYTTTYTCYLFDSTGIKSCTGLPRGRGYVIGSP